jgi:hypothetical protein
MTAALRLGDLRFQSAVEPTALQTLAIAGDGNVLQTQVDADRLLGGNIRLGGVFDWQTEPPITYGILGEAALLPFHALESVRLEYTECFPAES